MIAIDLTGKTVLVTGATSELGRAMVRTFAAAGAGVGVHYHRNQVLAQELVQECRHKGVPAAAFAADITVQAEVEALRDAVTTELAAPDIIVTNAVIQYQWHSVLEQDADDYESQFRSCVLQNVFMAKAFVPAMIAKGWGRVVALNTECTMQCWPNQSAYIAGKAGMDRVLRVLAREVGEHGITVNQVAPGWTLSENRGGDNTPQWYLDRVALKRRGTDQEIADAVVFLASDLATFITGVYLPVTGGMVMPGI